MFYGLITTNILTDSSNMLETLLNIYRQHQLVIYSSHYTFHSNNELRNLDVDHNTITDEAYDAITIALEKNSCLGD